MEWNRDVQSGIETHHGMEYVHGEEWSRDSVE